MIGLKDGPAVGLAVLVPVANVGIQGLTGGPGVLPCLKNRVCEPEDQP